MDTESNKLITRKLRLQSLTRQDGWKDVEEIFSNLVLDMQSINNIDTTDPTMLAIELKAKRTAIEYFIGFMNLIRGEALDAESYEKEVKSYILRK